jgi:UDP:flavonoid glycosyltransferase YjiC (YdhE family)
MRILISSLGSRGDVQPYIALARGLQHAGHAVTLSSDATFASFAAQYGVPFAPLDDSLTRLINSAQGKDALNGKGRLKLMREVGPMLRNLMDMTWAVAQDLRPDLLLFHSKQLGGQHIAEKLGIPGWITMALPTHSPTRAFASPTFGGGNYGGLLNRFTHTLLLKGATAPYAKVVNAFRRESLGLGPFNGDALHLHGKPLPRLYGYSEHVLPRPADWDKHTVVTGYWFLPAPSDWQPSRALLAFLDAGPPPVYIGFGSMAANDAEHSTRIVLDAVESCAQRAIIASGWGGLSSTLPAGERVFALDAAPHDWLFPGCAAVVHHGGAGTTAAGLRAGKPSVICPFFGDQPFWGGRVHALGAGPKPLPHKSLTADALAAAITQAVSDPTMHARAEALGRAIAGEDGIAKAVAALSMPV